MKKIIASLAAIATVLSLSVASFAVEPGDSNSKAEGTETIKADAATEFVFDNGNEVEAAAGAFEAGKEVKIELEASKIEDNAGVDAKVSEAVAAAAGNDVAFNTKVSITATADGVAVQPNGDITITVADDGVSNAVAYVDADGKVEPIALSEAKDGKVSFTVKHFSDFYMVKVADVDAFLKSADDTTNTEAPAASGTSGNPNTGVAIAIVPAAIAAAAVVVSKKRK